jgi:Zn-dependent peptidase ImmA (M78 family)/transcriptional regulator with XRE-family HTH domain
MGGGGTADRVRRLIEDSGLTQAEFADQVGLDGPKLSKSLAGIRRFTSLDLARIAEFSSTTVDTLLGVGSPIPALAARASEAVEPTAVDTALAEAARYAEVREDLATLNETAPLPPLSRPQIRRGLLIEQGERLASEALGRLPTLRDVLNRDLGSVIERHFDTDVAVVKLVAGFDGLAWLTPHTRMILVGASRVPGRQRFTMAHELGHLFAQDSQDLHIDRDMFDQNRQRDPSETRANVFAAAFLMPEDIVRQAAKDDLTFESFAALSCELSVSPSSLAYRLLSLGLIDEPTRARFGAMKALQAAAVSGQTADFAEWIEESSRPRPPAKLLIDTLNAYLAGKSTLRPFANLVEIPIEVLEESLTVAEDAGVPVP